MEPRWTIAVHAWRQARITVASIVFGGLSLASAVAALKSSSAHVVLIAGELWCNAQNATSAIITNGGKRARLVRHCACCADLTGYG